MKEKVVDWLTEKFGADLKRLPSCAIFAAIFGIILAWAKTEGEYKSALTSLLNMPLSNLLEEDSGLSSLIVATYVSYLAGILLCYFLLKLAAKVFFRYVLELPTHQEMLKLMVVDHQNQNPITTLQSFQNLDAVRNEIEKRRLPVQQHIHAYNWLALLGLALISQTNSADVLLGLTFIVCALISLYRAIGIFIAKVIPWHAKAVALEGISLLK